MVVKSAQKITDSSLPSAFHIFHIYIGRFRIRASCIMKEATHPTNGLFASLSTSLLFYHFMMVNAAAPATADICYFLFTQFVQYFCILFLFFFLFLFACYFILFIYCVLFYFYSNFITLLGPELSIYFWVTIKNIWTLKRIVDSDFPPSAPHSAREKRGRIKVDICCRIPTAVPQQCGENAVEARSSPLTQDPHQSRNNCLWGGVRCLLSLEIFKFFVRKQVKFLRELIPPYCPHSSYAPRSALRMLRLTHRIHLSHTNPVFYR